MKTVIKVTNSQKSFYHGVIGTNIYSSIDEALDEIIKLKNKTSCVSYKVECNFSIEYLADVIDKIDTIKGKTIII